MQNELAPAIELPQEQPLAVWRLERARRTNPLPRELARTAIVHYSDPGELVLVPKLRGGELPHAAAALGRRALPLAPSAAKAENLTPLHRNRGAAALVLAPLAARPSARRLQRVAASLLPLLKPGGFLALARGTAATDSSGLGEIVRSCQGEGLQYWQHVIALTPEITPGATSGAPAQASSERKRSTDGRRAVRCHHDLLVFRRPAEAIEQTTSAAAAATAA
jgi:hypothetical protein